MDLQKIVRKATSYYTNKVYGVCDKKGKWKIDKMYWIDQKTKEGLGDNGRSAKDWKIWKDWSAYSVRQNTTSVYWKLTLHKESKGLFSKIKRILILIYSTFPYTMSCESSLYIICLYIKSRLHNSWTKILWGRICIHRLRNKFLPKIYKHLKLNQPCEILKHFKNIWGI